MCCQFINYHIDGKGLFTHSNCLENDDIFSFTYVASGCAFFQVHLIVFRKNKIFFFDAPVIT